MARNKKAAKRQTTNKTTAVRIPQSPDKKSHQKNQDSKSTIHIPTLDPEQIVPYLATILLIGAGWLVFIVYRSYAWPSFIALLLYVGFDGLNRLLTAYFKGKRNLAALLTVVFVVLVILLPSIFLLSSLIEQFIDLGMLISSALKSRRILYTLQTMPWLADFVTSEPFFWIDLIELAESSSNEYLAMLDTASLGNWVSNIFFIVKGSVSLTLSFVANLLLALITLFFLFRDGPTLYRLIKKSLPFSSRLTDQFTGHMRNLIRAVLWGNVFVSFMQGAAISIGLSICNIDNSIVYGFVAAIFAMIPVVGTAVVWAPTSLYLIATGQYGLAIFIAIYGISMYLILENIFKPKLLDRKLGVHPLLLFFAILGGLAEFGISGVILGPLFVTLFMTMWKIYHVWGSNTQLGSKSK